MLQGLLCERCGHKWLARDMADLPEVCPDCKSPYWDKARKLEVKKKDESVKGGSGSRGSSVRGGPVKTRPIIRKNLGTMKLGRKPVQKRFSKREIDRAGIGGAT
jgi:hypothetical protein